MTRFSCVSATPPPPAPSRKVRVQECAFRRRLASHGEPRGRNTSRALHGSRDSSRSRKHAWHGVQAAQGAELAPHRRLSGAKGLIRARFERNRSDELPEKRKKEVLGGFPGARRRSGGAR